MLAVLFARLGVAERLRGPLTIVAALIAVCLCVALLARCAGGYVEDERREAVQVNIAEAAALATKQVRAAEEAATVNAIERDAKFANAQEELNVEVRKGTDDRAGPAVSGVLERMRKQQAEGRR